jgi:hypothetical protein
MGTSSVVQCTQQILHVFPPKENFLDSQIMHLTAILSTLCSYASTQSPTKRKSITTRRTMKPIGDSNALYRGNPSDWICQCFKSLNGDRNQQTTDVLGRATVARADVGTFLVSRETEAYESARERSSMMLLKKRFSPI